MEEINLEAQPVGEELQEVKVEEKQDETAQKLDAIQKELAAEKAERKKISSMLTKQQQENSEWLKYFKSEKLKTVDAQFEDTFANNPQAAVEASVQARTQPISQEQQQMKAQLAFQSILVENSENLSYRERILELSNEFPEDSWDEKGIRKLLRLAKAEGKKPEVVDSQKARAFSEGSSPSLPKPKTKQLTPAQMNIIKKMGVNGIEITPEQYLKSLERLERQDGVADA